MMRLVPIIVAALLFCSAPCRAASYGVARTATPVLNSPAFSDIFGGPDGRSLKTDRCGQVRQLEFIALPGTVFRLLERFLVPRPPSTGWKPTTTPLRTASCFTWTAASSSCATSAPGTHQNAALL